MSVTGAHSCVEELKIISIDLTKRAIAPTPAKKAPPKKVVTKKSSARKAPAKWPGKAIHLNGQFRDMRDLVVADVERIDSSSESGCSLLVTTG